jgi:precorrin-3B synthase
MSTGQPIARPWADACPGVLRLTAAADGALARVRLPGGFLTAHGATALASAAAELGDGRLELTSRGNVQLRGLAQDAGTDLGERLYDAGLWPSQSHERVRNIVASPLAGLDRASDVSHLVHALDEALCDRGALVALSGRFLYAVDDGRGDVAGLGADVLVRPGMVNGLATGDEVGAALAFAEAFLDERAAQRSDAWRITDLVEGTERVQIRVAARLGLAPASEPDVESGGPPPAGLVRQFGGGVALVVAVPLGRLSREQLRWLTGVIGDRAARITPWRTIVLPDADTGAAADAAELGLGVTADSPWLNVSACAGRPGCGKALADVQADARAALDRWPGQIVHWSGCERRCGRGTRTDIDVVATESRYRIEGA